MEFLLEMVLTWMHIITGLTFFFMIVLTFSIFLRMYNEYADRKEMKSEMDRLRDAMKFTKQDMESKR